MNNPVTYGDVLRVTEGGIAMISHLIANNIDNDKIRTALATLNSTKHERIPGTVLFPIGTDINGLIDKPIEDKDETQQTKLNSLFRKETLGDVKTLLEKFHEKGRFEDFKKPEKDHTQSNPETIFESFGRIISALD